MELDGKVVVVTGGASGIGKALAKRFHAEGARAVVVADRDADGAAAVAASIGGTAVGCDVADEAQVKALVDDMGYDIAVLDDGRGFDVDDVAPTRLGVRVGIARRMARVPGGRVRIASSPGQGTRVRITWERT